MIITPGAGIIITATGMTTIEDIEITRRVLYMGIAPGIFRVTERA
jgi:hypothetical protein